MWHAIGKSRPFGRENLFRPKKHLKKGFFLRRFFRPHLTLGRSGGQTVDTRSTSGYPWKVWGITVQTSYVEGRWHQNWVRSSPAKKKTQVAVEFREKWKFFVNRSVPENFQWENFFGASTHGIVTHSGFRKCIWKVGTTNFWPCFACPKLGDAGEIASCQQK